MKKNPNTPNSRKSKINVRNLVLMALLSAISIILTRFLSIQVSETLRIGFGSLPIVFSGMVLGPVAGGIVGIVSDVLGFIINPAGGVFLPGFTLSSALTGIIPGLIVLLLKNKKSLLTICVANIAVFVLVHLILDTYWLNAYYGKAFMVLLPLRVLPKAIIAAVSIIFTKVLIIATDKLYKE